MRGARFIHAALVLSAVHVACNPKTRTTRISPARQQATDEEVTDKKPTSNGSRGVGQEADSNSVTPRGTGGVGNPAPPAPPFGQFPGPSGQPPAIGQLPGPATQSSTLGQNPAPGTQPPSSIQIPGTVPSNGPAPGPSQPSPSPGASGSSASSFGPATYVRLANRGTSIYFGNSGAMSLNWRAISDTASTASFSMTSSLGMAFLLENLPAGRITEGFQKATLELTLSTANTSVKPLYVRIFRDFSQTLWFDNALFAYPSLQALEIPVLPANDKVTFDLTDGFNQILPARSVGETNIFGVIIYSTDIVQVYSCIAQTETDRCPKLRIVPN